MSLEQALAENTAAIRELAAITKDLLAVRVDAIEKVGAAAASTKTSTKKAAEETKANISASPEDRKDPASDNPYEGIKEIIAGYIGGTQREEERAARKAKVKALLNHEKVKKADVSDASAVDHIMESAIDLFKSQMRKLVEKGDLTEAPAPKSDDLDL